METFRTRIQYEEDGCPWCGFLCVRNEREPSVVVTSPPIQRIVTPNLEAIVNALTEVRWIDAKEELIKASQALGEKRFSDACNNMRMGLMLLWAKVAERLSGQLVTYNQSGKTVDLTPLVKILRDRGVPEDAVGLISRTWSFLSERTHIEKKGAQPRLSEAYYGYQLTLAAIEFLLRFTQAHRAKTTK